MVWNIIIFFSFISSIDNLFFFFLNQFLTSAIIYRFLLSHVIESFSFPLHIVYHCGSSLEPCVPFFFHRCLSLSLSSYCLQLTWVVCLPICPIFSPSPNHPPLHISSPNFPSPIILCFNTLYLFPLPPCSVPFKIAMTLFWLIWVFY